MIESTNSFFNQEFSIETLKIIASIIAIFLMFVSGSIVKYYTLKIKNRYDLSPERYYTTRHKINLCLNFLLIIALIFIWSINIKELWVAISSVIALIALAFFAVWSIIVNILAGILLFFTNPFKIGDIIEIHPDGVKGKVLAINTFFALLEEEKNDGTINHISIPNSLFFQKYIKKIKKNPTKNLSKKETKKDKSIELEKN